MSLFQILIVMVIGKVVIDFVFGLRSLRKDLHTIAKGYKNKKNYFKRSEFCKKCPFDDYKT